MSCFCFGRQIDTVCGDIYDKGIYNKGIYHKSHTPQLTPSTSPCANCYFYSA